MVKHIVSFSGGKDSTGMLLKMLDEKMPIDEVIFIDSSVEFPQLYSHIKKVDDYLFKDRGLRIKTIRAPHTYEYYLGEHVKKNGQVGYGHPDFKNQWCTQLLKKSVIKRYFNEHYKGLKIIEYHGIAYDEIERSKKNKEKVVRYPLIEFKMTEKDALEYSYAKGFDFGGLYKDFVRVSCFCCPMKRIGELRILHDKYPELWERIRKMDKKSFRKFRPTESFDDLDKRFNRENYINKIQLNIFKKK